MKRFHVHVSVEDLGASVQFYSKLFAAPPTVQRTDYAKWMLEDPRVNFAISQRGQESGVNHLGFQTESAEELEAMRTQLQTADASLVEQTAQACCYARSDKYWITDPAGIAWETFHTLESIPVFGEPMQTKSESAACCIPIKNVATSTKASCCVPSESAAASEAACCG